ncbi:3-chloro-4-hydroxyphenylacetate reductive dehalogenase [termite gut metagenome]|uniref:3-chloro-4-hydroxyphenylacetate reductive dehalogenase n=1 Tax=termite gut metagenome TaxID=433724 RepID=A0A5J4R9Z2_9ZZZZ
MGETSNIKQQIIRKAKQFGAELIGFASVDRWKKYDETQESFFPQQIFPFTRTVIVLAVPIQIPMLDTTPSIVYAELYNTTNRLLDEIAYKLAAFINTKGHRAVFFPRDAYGDISVLVEKPEAAFSHVLAAKYAGLGTIGYNHTLLTKEFGPRVRLVSVLTDVEITPDDVPEKGLCIKCELCRKCCPTSAFTSTGNVIADMNKYECAEYHKQLKERYRYPCGVCIKVCPIGKDRKLYGMDTKKYLNEKEVLKQNPEAEEYSDWTHLRNFGAK